jgi:peptidoglycan/xylan/chitin deacetylase (PgdA/CDA1 family)
LYVSEAEFDRQLGSIGKLSQGTTSLDQLAPGRIVVSFDDGSATTLGSCLDILARHKVRAIQFLLPGLLGGRNTWDVAKGDQADALMTESQVREWLAAGHEIGSHSLTHRNLRHLSIADAREEIMGSKKALEDKFGRPIRHFSYPYGSWNPAVRDVVKEAGYETASTMRMGFNDAQTPPLELRRLIPLSSRDLVGKVLHRLKRKTAGR